MLPSDYSGQNCSVARALEVMGERWSMLIIREAFLGTRRFDHYQRRLGVARNVLQTRLERLIAAGVLEKVPYQERPVRYEYKLTRKGIDLWPSLVALLQWGDKHAAPNGPPVVLEHKGCGGALDDRRRCLRCGAELQPWDVKGTAGPGARPEQLPAAAA
jgi:DNA-binding HxlR family transcriptional regulator